MRTYTDTVRAQMRARYSSGTRDEFTGDPIVRDLWEKSRDARHTLIRSMYGDTWAEASWLSRIGTVIGNGTLWVVGVPFLWAALMMAVFFSTAVILALGGLDKPVEDYLGTGGSGGLGDFIVWGSLLVSVVLMSFVVWGKLAFKEAEVRRLRGLSNTDLLKAHAHWMEQKAREAEASRRQAEAWERQRNADYLARRIGEETRHAAYEAGIQLKHFHDFSERIAGRRP